MNEIPNKHCSTAIFPPYHLFFSYNHRAYWNFLSCLHERHNYRTHHINVVASLLRFGPFFVIPLLFSFKLIACKLPTYLPKGSWTLIDFFSIFQDAGYIEFTITLLSRKTFILHVYFNSIVY